MNCSINPAMGLHDWLMLVALSVLWGGSFFFVELALRDLSTLTVVWLRVTLAAAAMWAFAAAIGLRLPTGIGPWRAFVVMGVLNNLVPFSLIVWGQNHIASGLAAILNATTPLFTVLVAGLVLADERMNTGKLLGAGIGFFGVVTMIGPQALTGFGTEILAQLAVLGAALSYAMAGVFGRRFKAMGVDPIVTAAGQVTASAAIMAPVALYLDQPWNLPMPGVETLLAIGALAILSTGLAYILYFRILASAGATNLLLVTFLIPVSAILLGFMVLGESLQSVHFMGMAVIGVGLSVIDGRWWRALRRSGPSLIRRRQDPSSRG